MIEQWTRGHAGEHMPEEILVGLGAMIRRHPWWRARALLTIDLLHDLGLKPPSRVLDAGCGWGVTLEALESSGFQAAGLDISRLTLQAIDRPGRRLIEADLARPLPPRASGYDAVLALDVIEHLDDDRAAVRRLGTLARPGGRVIVSVPALPDLFGEFDAIQGHRRRYLPDDLKAAFEGSGLDLERLFWWGRWLVPTLRRQRSRSRTRPGDSPAEGYRRYLELPPWPAVAVARLAFSLERRRAIEGRLDVGTSLFAVARRPDGEGHRWASPSRSESQSSSPATQTA